VGIPGAREIPAQALPVQVDWDVEPAKHNIQQSVMVHCFEQCVIKILLSTTVRHKHVT
jgi:hypothetical protein